MDNNIKTKVVDLRRGKILHDGHQEFLSEYPNGQVRIHAAQTRRHAGRRHRALQIVNRVLKALCYKGLKC